jgi:hypothetical protein
VGHRVRQIGNLDGCVIFLRLYNSICSDRHYTTKENKMVSKEQIDRIVDAIEGVSMEISDNSSRSLAVDDYNLVSSIWETLNEISNSLKKIEAKMK